MPQIVVQEEAVGGKFDSALIGRYGFIKSALVFKHRSQIVVSLVRIGFFFRSLAIERLVLQQITRLLQLFRLVEHADHALLDLLF